MCPIPSAALSHSGSRKKEGDALYDKADADAEEDEGETLTAHEKILLGRKRLPIFAYRE